MWNDDDRKWLYEQMKSAGVDTGTYDDFKKSLNNQEDRDWYYQKSRSLGLDVGSANDFAGMMVEPQQAAPTQEKPQQPASSTHGQQHEEDVRPQQPTVQIPSVVDLVEKNRFKPMPMLETEAYIDENGDRATRVKRVPGFDSQGRMASEGVYRDVLTGETYDPTDPNTQQVVEQTNQRMSMPTPIDLERSNREQVASLTKNIDDALKEAKGQSIQQYYDRTTKAADKGFFASLQEAMMMTAGAADPTDMQRQTRNWIQRSEGVPTEEGMALNRRINDLETAQRTMRNAQRIIDEADHNAQGGTFSKWLESSFAGGAARGFGQKFFDIDTWDMGLSDMQDATGLLSALQAFDSGKELTESQQILLDAKAVELATNAYFGSYVGRGYKAGQVTAESIPFMIEMCLNPAAGTGNAAENMLARYAIKRFGKDTVKRNAKKYVASKVGARVTGDIVGSATMAATTGAIGVTADAIDRSNGQVQFDTDEEGNSIFAGHSEGDDFSTAFGKAFAARTIENYSELFGEYFAPVLEPVVGAIGKGFTKAAGSKVGSKLGLESVNDFMQNVAASDVAKIVTDFEKHARWNGVFGEYVEEVAGGIMNALVVGDQTLDTNPDTGVFNLDNNIDTFLGVSLMGGFMSAVKTAGYRTPKYRARQDMKAKDDAAAAVFGNQDTWGDIRNTLAFGEDADVRQKLAEVLSNPDITPVQRAAVLEYAQAVETYRGMLQGENKKRDDEDADPVQTDAETSFDNGYSLESDQEKNDAKNMYEYQRQRISDFATDEMLANLDNDPVGALNAILGSDAWTDEEKQTATDYVNAKATYDGMISHVQEDIDSRIHASDLLIDGRVNPTDGMIHPATMKMDDRKVYVVGGNIVMNDEGTMIDNEKSDESVIIRDAETGNMEFADPRDVLSVDETLDAAQVKQEAQEAIRMEYAQQAADSIDGVLPFYDNDTYTAIDEQGQQHSIVVVPNGTVNSQGQILQAGEGEVLVSVDGAEPAPMSRAAIQDMVDNTNLARLRDYETERAARREAQAEAEREASRPVYNLNDVVTLQTDEGPVRGSITAEENEDGLIEVYTERPIGGKKIDLYNRDQLDGMLVEQNGTEVVSATTDVVPGETADNNSGENIPPTGNIATENISSSDMEQQAMPMVGEGEDAEPDFSKATPQRAHAYIYNEAGLDREEANQFVEANKKAADKALTTIQGKKPKMGTSLAKYRKETAEWQQKVSEALAQADYWKQVKDEQQKILAAEAQARAERDAVIHEQAIAEEQQRQEEELRKREAQAQLGSNNVAPQISEKWNAAPKVDGARNEIVLANGERVPGHYVLVESGAATPSHNPATGFAKNEGFPMDENEQSVNDRDYERDQDAQAITRQIADQYDSRAMQTPVVVSSDGVVLSGNGRTMAGELAAQNGTDGAYIEYLKKYGQQYGFTPEQVDGMAHPRVLFVPDEAMPYTADTFAKFNQQEMKGQSKTEQAVKLGKIVDNDTFGRIIRSINAYDTLSDFYADPTASANAIQELAKAGAISQAQYAEMFDGDTISSQGREILENMLIGKAFESNPDAVREITAYKGVRQSIICALAEISNNLMLGKEYSLESELAQAIELVYQARYNGYKAGERVSSFARQLNLFPFDEGESVADYTNAAVMMLADVLNDNRVTRLKKVLTIYNHHAQDSANGQMDLFTGDVESKEEILNTVKSLLNNGTEEEQQSAIDAAVEQRTAAATAGTTAEQSEGTEQAGTTGNVDKGGEVAPTGESVGTTEASIASAEAETEQNPTEAQKEAGNYKKGHVKIDGFDISIENPKGSERSGTDASGKPWSVTMNNTYGYIRRTEGVDGDHIDVFLSDHIEDWNGMVYVVDQVNTDGSFDEHKVMYGFNSEEEARAAYLSNYSEGWQGLGTITGVSKDEFKKWIDSSHRKTKAFAEYKSVKAVEPHQMQADLTPEEQTLASRIEVTDNEWEEGDGKYPTYKREILIDGKHKVIQIDSPDKNNNYTGSYFEYDGNRFGSIVEVVDNIDGSVKAEPKSEEKQPYTDFNKFVEDSGVNVTEQEIIRPLQKIADRLLNKGNVEVQEDSELGFTTELAEVSGLYSSEKDALKKYKDKSVTWVDESQQCIYSIYYKAAQYKNQPDKLQVRKEYLIGNKQKGQTDKGENSNAYTVTPHSYTTKRGKVLNMQLVKFDHDLSKDEQKLANSLARKMKGWWSKEDGGFLLRSEEDAESFANTVQNPEALEDEQPMSLADVAAATDIAQVEKENANTGKFEAPNAVSAETEQQQNTAEGATISISKSKWVDDEDAARFEELKRRMKMKMRGQMNMGIDPEILAIGTEMAFYVIKHGARQFGNYASAMIDELGDTIRPYLKSFYNGARDFPEMETYAEEMTPYDEVRTFDVANFDKPHPDAMATAEQVVAEQEAEHETEQAKEQLKSQRNEQRKKSEQEVAANTATIAEEAEVVASQAETLAETSANEHEINRAIEQVDDMLDKVNDQLALLGYYEFDEDDSKLHESYGYMLTAEKKALKDATDLAKQLVNDLGIDLGKKLTSAETLSNSKKRKDAAVTANIAPAGGEITIRLPLNEGRKLAIYIGLNPVAERGTLRRGDNLAIERILYRMENPNVSGWEGYGRNMYAPTDVTYANFLSRVKQVAKDYLPEQVNKESTGNQVEKSKKRKKSQKESTSLLEQTVTDLFSDFFNEENNVEPLNNSNNGLQRNDAVRSEGLPADGNHHEEQAGGMGETSRQESVRTDRGGQEGRGSGVQQRDNDGVRPSEQLTVSLAKRDEESSERPATPKNTRNNHAERGTDYAPKAVDARIQANIKAIELMQQLIESGEKATPEQMAVLRQFSGWGGLGKAFENERATYNGKPIYQYLKELLGDEAYQQANKSRNSAYYTPANIIDTLWDIAKAMGFKGGKVLEGSAGIGNILGLMPTDISERSDIHAVEIDSTTGNILSLLYPDAQVDVQGFEATPVENGSVDLAITNVPFVTGMRVYDTTGDKDLSRKFHDIQDFCIAKNIRKLRDGGIGIFITSSGTLDNSTRLREWIVGEGGADVVGAFRLNNETFGGTGATSDIIVVRKRVNGRPSPHAIDVSHTTGERVAEYDTGETKKVKGVETPIIRRLSMDYNQYFVEHPEMMAGEMRFAFEKGDTFRPTSKALYPAKGKDQNEMLSQWANSFTEKEWEASSAERSDKPAEIYEKLGDDVKEGSMLVDGKGVLCIAQRGKAVPIMSPQAEKGKPQKSDEERLSLFQNKKVKGHSKAECFQSYKAIKDALSDVLEYQTTHEDNAGLQPLLDRLNKAFDSFVNTYDHLHKNPSISFLKNDVDFANILALEKFSERSDVSGKRIQEYGKTDIFSRRVVEREKAPEPKNVKDGIIASLYIHGRIDVPYISEQLNMPENDVKAEIIKSGLGFESPVNRQMEVSYEYLSGNVREKLQQAIDNNQDGKYNANIKALEKVIPMNIPAHLIDFSIGSSWIDPKLYEEYVKEKTDVEVTFTPAGGTWFMKAPHFVGEQKNRAMGVKSNMFNRTIMGTQLIEAAMQNRTITISETHKKWDGSTETITDKEATQACANKIDEIRQDFKEWARAKMQSDPSMSEHIEQIYNEMFNNYVPKSIPDEFVPQHFSGQVTELNGIPFSLRPHQGKAVVRGTTQPLLLAHEVGTGKTFTLISIAMEMRRLGTARKPMIVVQNATVGQFVESAKAIYPNAKVLTLEDKDHTGEGRKNFYAKIKYNDWDMIVVPQSVFERIPDSEERQMNFVQDKIDEKMLVLEQMKEADPDGESIIVRQAEKEIAKLEDELATLTGTISDRRKERDEKKEAVTRQNAEVKALEMLDRNVDDVEDFDDMGIDAILVDEAHEYKHLGFATAMQRGVKGVDPSYSKKAQGVYLKAQAVLEKNHGRNVIFATGTPISNTAAEIWTFMRYLMPADTMKEYDIYYFDDFVRNFGNLAQMLEFTTSGKFKENNRFAGYVNLPELVRIWSGVADTVLTREAGGVNDKIPNMEGGKAQDIYLPQTRALRSVMKYVKKQLNDYDKMSGKQKKENSHIPLTMYGIAKAAAVDARLVVTDAADEPQSKTNEAVRQTLRSLEETASYKGTVALFADNYQNKRSGFNLYEDIRKKLITEGVPEEQIVVMKSGMSVKKKLEIFDKVNRGEIRVIMGSTFTLGTGVNIQERLHTLIHLDAPNRPMDYTQRNGRILRQGNLHKQMDSLVRVLRFGVEDSLDVTAYQRLKTKGAIADSIMNGKQMMQNSMENRALEEEEDVFGDTVAQLSGSEYAMLKNQAEKDVRKYTSKKKQWEDDQTYCHNEIPRLEGQIKETQKQLDKNRKSLATVEALPEEKPITIGKQTFTTIESMADFLKDYNKKIKEVENELRDNPSMKEQERRLTVNVGGIDFAFKTVLNIETRQDQGTLFSAVHRKMTYSCEALGLEDVPVKQSLLREGIEDIVANVVTGNDFREKIERLENSQEKAEKTLSQVRERDGKPFEFEKELEQAKERFEEYSELMKKELEEKEAKYAEMDSEVEELDSDEITVAEEASEEEEENEERLREGDDVETMSYEESLSSARRAGYTKKQHDAMLSRQWRRMREHAENAISRLGLIGRVTVLETAEGLKGRKAKAKGWYDAKTGKIVVVMSNHHSTSDIVRTILHEGVAHYGLRVLFGRNFDQFLDNVFQYADTDVRRSIVDLAKKHGWNFRVATEEYLAGLAEDTDFERATRQGWWSKIKSFFLDMLHSIGLGNYGGAILTDNELRYILWRSYENLAEPGRYRNPFRVADDISKQMQLKVGSFDRERARIHRLGRIDSSSHVINQSVVADTGVRFRDGDFSERDRVTARDAYERMVSSGLYQFREAVQDSMLGLRKLYEAILQKGKNFRIEEVDGYENAYLAENRMSSKNSSEQHDYYNHFMRPLLEAIGKIAGSKKGARQALTDYMMAKHGLERNLVFAERDAREAEANGADYADAYAQYREKDYSGLTALTGEKDLATAEAKAQQMVDDYEAAYDTADLWSLTREATQATLEKIYKSGLLNRERYESIRDMFQYYIPLQGWDETTSDEVYGYLTSKNGLLTGSPIKHAAGRSSKADDPIATIAMMADAAISQGNRNQMKQRFLNFALNHPSDLISVHDLWLQYDAATDEWVPVFADLEEGDTAADVARKVEAFEQRMEQLAEAEPDKYKRGRDTQNIPYKVVRNNLKEHQVLVKRDGRTYVLTINGNPRAAQALNGLTNPDVEQGGVVGNLLKAGEYVNRQLSAFYTTRNPDFVVSNFFRDMLYSNCMTWVKENPRYALRYHKNFGRLNPVTMRRLLGKWENGNLDMSNKTEQLFYQFMINGGETGYTSVRDIEAHKQAIAVELKKQGSVGRRAWSALGMQLDLLNRGVENCARFAAFVTSREMGRSIDRSIYDAKEVSVNFNKKGSGGKMVNATGQTLFGKVGSYVGGGGRLAYVFWNAGIQGLTNFGRAGKRHGAKAFAGASAMFILGYLIPQLAAAMGGGDGDDDDKNAYYNLPEYVRRSNICFRVGDQWVTIPLPIEFRALYGLGELATGVISGNEHYSNQELSYQIASQVSQILPLDMLEGGGGVSPFIPSTAKPFAEAYIMNKGWTGLPIYKDTPWNQNDPEWTKAYKNADQTLVGASKWLNEATGGDDFKKGAIDINPSKIEYLLSGMFGGYATTTEKLKKMGETALGNREFDWRNMLIANRVIKTGDERTANRKLQNEYFKYKKEYDETKRLLNKYENAADEGIAGMAEKANFLYNSPAYLRYELFDEYQDDINDYRDYLQETADAEYRKAIEDEMYATMRELVNLLHKTE